MKKRILIVNNHLRTGGAENSLISLLNQLDFSVYEVDLLLYHKNGSYIKRLPKQVNIIDSNIDEEYFLPFFESLSKSLKSRKFKCIILKIYSNFATKIQKRNFDQVNAIVMLKLSKWHSNERYDVAIAYKHIFSNFIINKIKAKRKIAYVHSDYISMGLQPKYDRSFLNKLNKIATVSEGCRSSLLKTFPELTHKVVLAPNIIAPSLIKKMSEEKFEIIDDYFEGIKLLTVARLDRIKGIDLAIESCSMLKKTGINFRWYIIGGGDQIPYKEKIKELGLTDIFIFLGEKVNPYPYIKEADIYVQPSRTEGKSIAIEEAKVLCKPIVVTNYPTVTDQIQDCYNGVIVPISSDGVYEGIKKMIKQPDLKWELSNNLAEERVGNEEDIQIFYRMIMG